MLRINVISNSSQAKDYYVSHLTQDDYYMKDQIIPANWDGKLAEILNLKGEITVEDYYDICNNINPDSKERLTQRNDRDRRVGYDFTFSVPKSVSIAALVNQDERIIPLVDKAIKDTMKEVEYETMTRVRKSGQNSDRVTGNILYAKFFHSTTRPVDGYPDPHLHCHVNVFNVTFDSVEGKYKAIELGEVKQNGNYYQQIFLNRVARGLLELGYPLRRTARDFELEYISDETIRKYSRRTSQIEDRIKEKGITNAKLKSMQGAETRNRKKYDLSKSEVEDYWQSRLSDNGKEMEKEEIKDKNSASPAFLQNLNPFRKRAVEQEILDNSTKQPSSFDKSHISELKNKAVKYSLDKNFERLTVRSHKQLVIDSLKYGIESGLTYSDVRDSFLDLERNNQLVSKPDKDHLYSRFNYTKQAFLNQEKEIIQTIENGKTATTPLNADFTPKNKILSQEQKDAVTGILSSKDQVILLAGRAGTGKTTTLKEVQTGALKNGTQVLALAPTTSAKEVLTQEGFANSSTLQLFLVSEELQKDSFGKLVIVDEAGLISSDQMHKLLKITSSYENRLLLVGDTRQHHSVEQGDALRIVEQETKTDRFVIKEIRRQSGEYLSATKDVSEGKILEGFDKLDKNGFIYQDKNLSRLYHQVAKDYVDTVSKGSTCLIVTPIHEEGEKISHFVRQELKDSGILDSKSREYSVLENLNWENAKKGDLRNYEKGLKLIFNNKIDGFDKGEVFEVMQRKGKINPHSLYLQNEKGITKAIPLDNATTFSVYKEQTIPLTKGDLIQTTKNTVGKDHNDESVEVQNGKIYKITGFARDGGLKIQSQQNKSPELQLEPNFKSFRYGYYSTSHKSQGMTVDRAINVNTTRSLPGINQSQHYVSITRGRKSLTIYTDDKSELRKAVVKEDSRVSASEMVKSPTQHKPINKEPSKDIKPKFEITFEKS